MNAPVVAPFRPPTTPNGTVPPRPAARRAVVVADGSSREQTLATLQSLGYSAEVAVDPYDAVSSLARDRLGPAALVLSLPALFFEDLSLVETVKTRLSHVEVVICDVDGRGAEFAEAMRLGADALLAGGFLHRLAPPLPTREEAARQDDAALTPDELHALLRDD